MRSIRRSMTLYMLLLLAATLGVVWVVIDQVTARALAAREEAGADKINASYQERCRNERDRIDQALLQQAKDLGNAMHLHYNTWFAAEFTKYAVRASIAEVIFGMAPNSGHSPNFPGLGPNLIASAAWHEYAYTPGSFIRPNPWSYN